MECTHPLDEKPGGRSGKGLLCQGRNCWRIARCKRMAFLIDAQAYFKAFYETVKRAERSVFIVGWDIDSRISLLRNNSEQASPTILGDFLNTLVRRKKGLHVHILTWDFAMVFALGRELFPIFRLPWKTSRRLHFYLDGEHPVGACHHQKIVVVDDAVAFVGGMDLSKKRWDTPEHNAHDDRRIQPAGFSYPPVHDVQMAVDGPVAGALGDLVRQRWKQANGRELHGSRENSNDPWPPYLQPDMENVDVAIARTRPGFKGRQEIREVETLYLDAIKTAHRFIYIENQYLTSHAVAKALQERLQEKDGPEIVLVLPEKCDGWLEQTTMGILRFRVLQSLRRSDRFQRLAVYFPHVPGLGDKHLNVHAKLMVVDDRFVRVGSANISNRSMAVDTECDLALEWQGNPRFAGAMADFRNRLLAEHLDVEPKEIAAHMDGHGSLIKAIEVLRGHDRTLKPLEVVASEWMEALPTATEWVDPEEAVEPESLVAEFIPEKSRQPAKKRIWGIAFFILALLGLAAAWRWTPLGTWLDLKNLQSWGDGIRDHPAGFVFVVGFYGIASLAVIPVTVMIIATAFIFGPLDGAIYAVSGCVFAATLTYYLGFFIGRDTVRRLAGTRVNRLSRRLGRHGLFAIMTVRLLPLAPFTIVNMVAGASHIRFRDFLLGTVLGMGPGIAAITVFTRQLEKSIYDPGAGALGILLLVVGVIIVGVVITRRWLGKSDHGVSD
jgi:phospholipase D1/2